MTERVTPNPLRLTSFASSPEGRALGKGVKFLLYTGQLVRAIPSVFARASPFGRGGIAGGDDGEGYSQPSQAHFVRQLSRGESPWQGREVSALYRLAGEGDTFRLRQSLALRERWHGVSRDGEGFLQGRTLSVASRQLSRGESLWQGREVSALYRSAGEDRTFRLRQSLPLSGEVARR